MLWLKKIKGYHLYSKYMHKKLFSNTSLINDDKTYEKNGAQLLQDLQLKKKK